MNLVVVERDSRHFVVVMSGGHGQDGAVGVLGLVHGASHVDRVVTSAPSAAKYLALLLAFAHALVAWRHRVVQALIAPKKKRKNTKTFQLICIIFMKNLAA